MSIYHWPSFPIPFHWFSIILHFFWKWKLQLQVQYRLFPDWHFLSPPSFPGFVCYCQFLGCSDDVVMIVLLMQCLGANFLVTNHQFFCHFSDIFRGTFNSLICTTTNELSLVFLVCANWMQLTHTQMFLWAYNFSHFSPSPASSSKLLSAQILSLHRSLFHCLFIKYSRFVCPLYFNFFKMHWSNVISFGQCSPPCSPPQSLGSADWWNLRSFLGHILYCS